MAEPRHLHLVASDEVPFTDGRSVEQLVLPGTEGNLHASLVLTSFRAMMLSGIVPMIEMFKPVLIIDIRVAPTFVPYRSNIDTFIEELQAAGTEYLHATRLVPSLDEREALHVRYLARLRANWDILAAWAQRARNSTVMLISSDPRRYGTDRHLVANEMQRQIKGKPLEIISV